jgi:hypothetical protein
MSVYKCQENNLLIFTDGPSTDKILFKGGLPTMGEKKMRYNFTLDRKLFDRFREKCGMIPYSRQVELLMREWVEGAMSDQSARAGQSGAESETSGDGPLLRRVSGREADRVRAERKRSSGRGG